MRAPVRRPCPLVVTGVEGELLPIAHRPHPVRIDPERHEIRLYRNRTAFPERQVVLRRAALIAMPFRSSPPMSGTSSSTPRSLSRPPAQRHPAPRCRGRRRLVRTASRDSSRRGIGRRSHPPQSTPVAPATPLPRALAREEGPAPRREPAPPVAELESPRAPGAPHNLLLPHSARSTQQRCRLSAWVLQFSCASP